MGALRPDAKLGSRKVEAAEGLKPMASFGLKLMRLKRLIMLLFCDVVCGASLASLAFGAAASDSGCEEPGCSGVALLGSCKESEVAVVPAGDVTRESGS